MVPSIALLISLLGWLFLIRSRKSEGNRMGLELTIALLWLLILASRPLSLWVHGSSFDTADDALVEGSPINRIAALIFLTVGIVILIRRRVQLAELVSQNKLLFCLIAYCALSILWSDFQLVALKRWIRHLGVFIYALVILTDPRGFRAVIIIIRYCAYILVPASIVLYKWYPQLGRHYFSHSGEMMITGVTMHKNQLGMLCMISAIVLLYEIHRQWSSGDRQSRKLYGDLCILPVVLWLLFKSHSATARMAFLLGGVVYLILWKQLRIARPWLFHIILAGALAITIGLTSLSGILTPVVDLTGHSMTFWGRMTLWKVVIGLVPNPIFGAGYSSFWLGDRLIEMWDEYWWKPTEAHNGFVEVYANLGFIGVAILIALIVQSYRFLFASLPDDPESARIKLTIVAMALCYNITEAGFLGLHPVWFVLVLMVARSQLAIVREPFLIQEPLAAPPAWKTLSL
jgi:exopolysaccharide production protein ExoQ